MCSRTGGSLARSGRARNETRLLNGGSLAYGPRLKLDTTVQGFPATLPSAVDTVSAPAAGLSDLASTQGSC